MLPTLNEEKKLWKRGYKRVVCLDEAGRGPLAGPVTAAAVTIKPAELKIKNTSRDISRINSNYEKCKIVLIGVKDSKKLSAKKRGEIFKIITKHPAIKWGIGIVSEKVIDKINIKNASELAMEKALNNLKCKMKNPRSRTSSLRGRQKSKNYFLIIDGNNIKNKKLKSIRHKLIVGADGKVFSCAMASIIAKVTRDRIMIQYHKKYPKYRFDLHKGYPTKLHFRLLKKYGPCKIHRSSFKPIAKN